MKKNYFFQVISQLDEEKEAFKETDVDGTAAPDIIPHSSKFHIPFFIFIIREEHNTAAFFNMPSLLSKTNFCRI